MWIVFLIDWFSFKPSFHCFKVTTFDSSKVVETRSDHETVLLLRPSVPWALNHWRRSSLNLEDDADGCNWCSMKSVSCMLRNVIATSFSFTGPFDAKWWLGLFLEFPSSTKCYCTSFPSGSLYSPPMNQKHITQTQPGKHRYLMLHNIHWFYPVLVQVFQFSKCFCFCWNIQLYFLILCIGIAIL